MSKNKDDFFYKEITKKIGIALHVNEIIDNRYFHILWGNKSYRKILRKEISERNKETKSFHEKNYSKQGADDLTNTLKTIVKSNSTYSVLYKFKYSYNEHTWILSFGTPINVFENVEGAQIVCASITLNPKEEVFNHIDKLEKELKKLKSELTISKLSKKELEILRLLGKGFSENEIVKKLSRSIHTIKTHIKNIKTKLDFKKNTELIKFATQTGII